MRHSHKVERTAVAPYFGCEATTAHRCDVVAHGNIAIVETCACGAVRRTNNNQRRFERGPWRTKFQEV